MTRQGILITANNFIHQLEKRQHKRKGQISAVNADMHEP
jgi:nucleoside phosphorylase